MVPEWPVPTSREYTLRLKGVSDFGAFLDDSTFSDVTLTVDGLSIPVHRIILSHVSPYFDRLFRSNFKENQLGSIPLHGVSTITLKRYIEIVYGKEVVITNWREAFDLFDQFNSTLLSWKKELPMTAFYVPSEEFLEYMKRLDSLFDSRIPLEVIKASRRFVVESTDLTGLSDEIVQLVR